jgi:hypothetical protein
MPRFFKFSYVELISCSGSGIWSGSGYVETVWQVITNPALDAHLRTKNLITFLTLKSKIAD